LNAPAHPRNPNEFRGVRNRDRLSALEDLAKSSGLKAHRAIRVLSKRPRPRKFPARSEGWVLGREQDVAASHKDAECF
jgi:hypothetical protein